MSRTILLDGESLTPEQLVELGSDPTMLIDLTPDAWNRVAKARETITNILKSGRTVYGVNTGFGNFQNTRIAPAKLEELQVNLIRSHCAGVGAPLPPSRARMLMALRVNVLAKGHSGISVETLKKVIDAYNKGVVPQVPVKGTVGASGDLAPLAHLAQGMIGEGQMCTWTNREWRDAEQVLKEIGVEKVVLGAKEGLAMINGTQFMTSLGCEALVRAINICRQADIVIAMTLEALQGSVGPLNPIIHNLRKHMGQQASAARQRAVLHSDRFPSEISIGHKNCGRVQDAYTLRCAPQVHGVVNDIVAFVRHILVCEVNCATDNPLIFPDQPTAMQVVSGGNFHGEYPAKALDMLGIAVHELGNISERRTERLNNPALSYGLPAFLIREGGLNSGFMIAHCTAAALVSENKVHVHPASTDSISTSAAQEDHVSMGGYAARKALKIVENVETILAIELLCACQAIEFLRPKKTTEPLEKVLAVVREKVSMWTRDRNVSNDINAIASLLRENKIWNAAAYAIPQEYHFDHPRIPPASKL